MFGIRYSACQQDKWPGCWQEVQTFACVLTGSTVGGTPTILNIYLDFTQSLLPNSRRVPEFAQDSSLHIHIRIIIV